MKNLILTLIASAAIGTASAAGSWTLDSCISYALEHNISVRQQALQTEAARLDVTSARDAFLPTVSASASEAFNFGRGLNSENIYVDRNSSTFQWGVSAQVPLFQGLENVRRLRYSRASLEQTLLEYDAARDDVALRVITQYLQTLYARQVVVAARASQQYSAYAVERQRTLVSEGKVAEADLYDAEAQLAQDDLQVVASEGDAREQLITLANLLQLPDATGFDIADLADTTALIPSAEQVWDDASRRDPSLLAARQRITAAGLNIDVARSGYLPRLSFGISTSSSFYRINGMPNEPFGRQMRNNYSTYLGFTLTVPIFDAFSTRNAVRRARLQRLEAELELDNRETALRTNIRLAETRALSARSRYLASDSALEATRKSFDAVNGKYQLGRATPWEFEQAKTNLFRTEVSRIEALCEFILRSRILIFYQHLTAY